MGKLTARAVKALVAKGKPGAHADGGNLYLRVAGPDAGKWALRYVLSGRAREMGLGAYDGDGRTGLTLAQARDAAEAQAKARTFRDVAEHHLSAHEAGWRNAKHRAQWRSTLESYV